MRVFKITVATVLWCDSDMSNWSQSAIIHELHASGAPSEVEVTELIEKPARAVEATDD